MDKPTDRLSIRLTTAQKEALSERSRMEGRSITEIVLRALDLKYIEKKA